MAGDWIAMRTALADDQAVIALTARFRGVLADEDHTVGKLHRLWSWADGQTETGVVMGVDLDWIDRRVGVPGFGLAMTELQPRPWLQVIEGGVRFPRWEEWNSESAKARLNEARRKRRQRQTSQRTRDKCPGSGGTNVPAHAGQMSGGNGDKCPGASGTDPGPQDRTEQERTVQDRTSAGLAGEASRVLRAGPGSGAGARPASGTSATAPRNALPASPASERIRPGPERVNTWRAMLERDGPTGQAWTKRCWMVMSLACRMPTDEWREQRGSIQAVARRLTERADRDDVAATIIELAVAKREWCRANQKTTRDAWRMWQDEVIRRWPP